jgi:serine/threonine-protein kinase RsbW
VEATIALRLPRDAAGVPIVRQLLDATLRSLGVLPQIRDDIQLMLSEACANAIRHARAGDDYTVSASLMGDRCIIKVVDEGRGFDPALVPAPRPGAEHGRGLQIMRALADVLTVVSHEGKGSVVRMEKGLHFAEDAPTPWGRSPTTAADHPDGHRRGAWVSASATTLTAGASPLAHRSPSP